MARAVACWWKHTTGILDNPCQIAHTAYGKIDDPAGEKDDVHGGRMRKPLNQGRAGVQRGQMLFLHAIPGLYSGGSDHPSIGSNQGGVSLSQLRRRESEQ
jgi:hypothetical protein